MSLETHFPSFIFFKVSRGFPVELPSLVEGFVYFTNHFIKIGGRLTEVFNIFLLIFGQLCSLKQINNAKNAGKRRAQEMRINKCVLCQLLVLMFQFFGTFKYSRHKI